MFHTRVGRAVLCAPRCKENQPDWQRRAEDCAPYLAAYWILNLNTKFRCSRSHSAFNAGNPSMLVRFLSLRYALSPSGPLAAANLSRLSRLPRYSKKGTPWPQEVET